MESHITHKKPSFIKILLNKIGLIDLHTKVNCWFCNQDTYILPGSKNTAEHWRCHLCENVNARDKNGDIIDPSPFQVEDKSVKVRKQPVDSSKPASNVRSLCRECQDGQSLIYQTMSDYIPDESDPSYEERCATADEMQAQLYQRYKLCPTCQKLIDQVVAEQKEALRFKSIDRTIFQSLNDRHINKRPSRRQYIMKGVVWMITHSATFLFIYYVMLHPPRSDTMMNWNGIVTKYLYLKDLDMDTVKELCTLAYTQEWIDDFKGFMACFFTSDDINCVWSMNDGLVLFILFNFVSLTSLDWNRAITPTTYEKARNLDLYKKTQFMLFVLRCILVIVACLGADKVIISVVSVVYIIILYYSDNMMKSKNNLRPIENSFILEESENETEVEAMDISEEPEMSVASSSSNIEANDEISNIINRFYNL